MHNGEGAQVPQRLRLPTALQPGHDMCLGPDRDGPCRGHPLGWTGHGPGKTQRTAGGSPGWAPRSSRGEAYTPQPGTTTTTTCGRAASPRGIWLAPAGTERKACMRACGHHGPPPAGGRMSPSRRPFGTREQSEMRDKRRCDRQWPGRPDDRRTDRVSEAVHRHQQGLTQSLEPTATPITSSTSRPRTVARSAPVRAPRPGCVGCRSRRRA